MSDSKVVSVRIDEKLLDTIRAQAEINHRAINGEILVLLEKGLEKYERDMEAVMAVQSEIKRVVG